MGWLPKLLVLVLVVAAALAPRWPRWRPLTTERRLTVIAISLTVALLGLRLADFAFGGLSSLTQNPTVILAILVLIAAIATALALGFFWSAILDDSRRAISRITVATLGLGFLLLTLASVSAWPFIVVMIALRSGWLKVAREQTVRATILSLIGLVVVLYWPGVPALPACWPPGCWFGASLVRHAQAFLVVQLGVVSLRLIFRLIFGPRRIGRRLLISHMMAGAVPSALIALFLVLVALLAMAGFRASLGQRMLEARHRESRQLLASCVTQVVASNQTGPATLDLVDIARRIAGSLPEDASWSPAGPERRLFVWLGAGAGAGERLLLADVTRAGSNSAFVAGWVETSPGDRQRPVAAGDTLRLRAFPGPAEWSLRPPFARDVGLVRAGGASYHVVSDSLELNGIVLRVQIIEPLPYGRIRVFEQMFGNNVWLDERISFYFHADGIRGELASSAERPPARLDFLVSGAAQPAAEDRSTTSYRSSYVLVPAQQWFPPGTAVPDSAAPLDNSRRVRLTQPRWAEVRLAVLGNSRLADLMPQIPAIRENPLSILPFIIIGATALLFIAVEAAAFASALRIGRAIAQSVTVLRAGTERLRTGDFAHRIETQTEDELSSLGDAFNEMAAGLEEGRRAALDRERLEGELEVARRIQQRLLPARPPDIAGLRIAGASLPARQVGGDYYDLLRLPSGRLLFVLADVAGKGVPAALLMSSVRASLHTMVGGAENLREIAMRLNRFLHASTADTEFVTMFLGLLDGTDGRLLYVNAGHDRPFVMRSGGALETLPGGSLLLGAFPSAPYEESEAFLNPGDLLFLYTDGLSEAMNPAADLFGEERITLLLRDAHNHHPDKLLQLALARVREFSYGAEQSDDITLLAILRETPTASPS